MPFSLGQQTDRGGEDQCPVNLGHAFSRYVITRSRTEETICAPSAPQIASTRRTKYPAFGASSCSRGIGRLFTQGDENPSPDNAQMSVSDNAQPAWNCRYLD
jgi:hypothetical protein